MARIESVERCLLEWAQWLKVGDGSGYPTKCTLHPHWSPPAAGMTPSLKATAPSAARATHLAVGLLSIRQANTLVMHYVLNLSTTEHALRVGCAPRTVQQRVEVAHRLLAPHLASLAK